MTHEPVSILSWSIVALNLLIVFGVSVPVCIRNLYWLRKQRAMREVIYAYEKDLREKGVTLPPRCVYCLQILPGHVDVCALKPSYEQLDFITECLSRPTIKYYPKGERPPEFEDSDHA